MNKITAALLSLIVILGLLCACAQHQNPSQVQDQGTTQSQIPILELIEEITDVPDAIEVETETEPQTEAPVENTFYLVLGDSIAYGSGLTNSVAACYGKIVADTNGYEYANHSVPGHTSANLITKLKEEEVIADLEKADIINISIGGNDFLKSDLKQIMTDALVNGNYTKLDKIVNNFYNNLCTIIDIINSHNPDATILVQTLYNPQSSDLLRDAYQMGVDRLNNAIKKYDSKNPGEIVIVDVGKALGADMANYAADTIHPSAKGNEKIAQTVLNKLYELKLGTETKPVITTKGIDKK